jgi:methylase of polypeptide subunit release factors
VKGYDIDANAVSASRLSLGLLHLVLTGGLPESLKVEQRDVIEQPEKDSVDVVIANPSYIRLESLGATARDSYKSYLGEELVGRVDAYLTFVKFALDRVEAGGFVCLVLPRTFLEARNASRLRSRIQSEFYVRHLVDLGSLGYSKGPGFTTFS